MNAVTDMCYRAVSDVTYVRNRVHDTAYIVDIHLLQEYYSTKTNYVKKNLNNLPHLCYIPYKQHNYVIIYTERDVLWQEKKND